MRIISGQFGGQRIDAPKGMGTRPTTDRVREALFSALNTRIDFDGIQVLDLFAGSGALGLEALSRGASRVAFVETASGARATIRGNMDKLGVGGQARVLKRDATKLGPRQTPAGGPFDLVFCDAPYGRDLVVPALVAAFEGGWIADDALIVAEMEKGDAFDPPAIFRIDDEKIYGDIRVVLMGLNQSA